MEYRDGRYRKNREQSNRKPRYQGNIDLGVLLWVWENMGWREIREQTEKNWNGFDEWLKVDLMKNE